jgi:hypothetical protein
MLGAGDLFQVMDGPRLITQGEPIELQPPLDTAVLVLALDYQELSAADQPPLGETSQGFLCYEGAPA